MGGGDDLIEVRRPSWETSNKCLWHWSEILITEAGIALSLGGRGEIIVGLVKRRETQRPLGNWHKRESTEQVNGRHPSAQN